MKIASVIARQVLDCKARPLLEVEIITDTGHVGRGAAPTGTSVGAHEAFVLRDGDRSEYNGLSVHQAVSAVTDGIAPVLVGAELDDPRTLDRVMIELDGTPDKHRLGGNSIYSTSIALLRHYPLQVGRDPIIAVHDLRPRHRHRVKHTHGFRMHLGILDTEHQVLAALRMFVRFLVTHRNAADIDELVRKDLHRQGLAGAIEIIGGHEHQKLIE